MNNAFNAISNPLQMFLEENCLQEGSVSCKELYDNWIQWCTEKKLRHGSLSAFGASMWSLGIIQQMCGSELMKATYFGIRLKTA